LIGRLPAEITGKKRVNAKTTGKNQRMRAESQGNPVDASISEGGIKRKGKNKKETGGNRVKIKPGGELA